MTARSAPSRPFRPARRAAAAARLPLWLAPLVAALIVLAAPLAAAAQEEAGRITVTAEGRATAAPDLAVITLGVEREAPSAAEAVAAMASGAEAVLAAVEDAGIAGRDVQTRGLDLSPRRERREGPGQGEIVGYVASTTVTVRVRELDSLGAVLDSVVGAGANLFRGLSFDLSDRQAAEDEARRAAVAEARRRAALYAEAAGVELGPLVRLEEAGGAPRPEMMRTASAMADGAAVPVAEGELELTARVTLVYEIAAP
jgi:hypothetical protein